MPDALEPNIEFWVNIFSLYSENEVIIHDAENLDIIYEIVNLNDYFPENTSMHEKWKKIKYVINDYRKILLKLAKNNHVVYGDLNDKERDVYLLLLETNDPQKYRLAAKNIRGQRGLKENFQSGIKKSGKYIPEFKRILTSYNLPPELCYLPHVESSFTNRAYSKSGAAGLWQFIRSTGRLYLNINRLIDERLDPYIATDAAARLLKENYRILGSWPLAITAYNHGLNGMNNARYKCRTSDFGIIVKKYKSRSFGFASKNFYAEFIAALRVVNNHEFYFGPLEFDKPIKFINFKVPENISIDKLSEKLFINKDLLIELNPALRTPITLSRYSIPKGYDIKLPDIENYDPFVIYAGLHQANEKELVLSFDFSDFSSGKFINPTPTATTFVDHKLALIGQINKKPDSDYEKIILPQIDIPVQELEEEAKTNGNIASLPAKPFKLNIVSDFDSVGQENTALSEEKPVYQDSLYLIRASVVPIGPQVPITLLNELEYNVDLTNIYNFDIHGTYWITVLPEETIGHYADWLNLSANYLRKINGFSYRREIQVGQRFKLAFSNTSVDSFNKKRLIYHNTIQNNFFSEYHIVGTTTYKIQPGDNIWKICNEIYNIPYWLIAYYNRDKKWDLLKTGDSISIPIISPFAQKAEQDYSG
ncbi:transglycosylase SLT domain-containing protein [candidate division KSB1 bacterium]|nr:transglycosylase SLT domain-containing protein [candidate division KSB1 bacterium]